MHSFRCMKACPTINSIWTSFYFALTILSTPHTTTLRFGCSMNKIAFSRNNKTIVQFSFMKLTINVYFGLAIALFLTIAACNDSSVIGLDLVEDDQLNLQYSEDIPFQLTTVLGEPIRTYKIIEGSGGNFPVIVGSYLLGRLEDPTFGVAESSIYSELGLNIIRFDRGNADFMVDSAILVMPYTLSGFYGDTTEEVQVEVYEIIENLDVDRSYTSDERPLIGDTPIATYSFRPTPNTPYRFLDFQRGGVDTLISSFLRIPLDMSFAQRFVEADTSNFSSNTDFKQFLNGLHLKVNNASNTMMSFDLSIGDGGNPQDPGLVGGMYLYYDTLGTEGNPREYFFPFSPRSLFPITKFTAFSHDYTNTPIEKSLEDEEADLVYIQGMAGVNIKVTLPDLSELENTIINQARLQLTLIEEVGSDQIVSNKPPPEQLLLFERIGPNNYTLIEDFRVAARALGVRLTDAYGGNLVATGQDSTMRTYTISMSEHLQRIVKGEAENEIYIRVASTATQVFLQIQDVTKANRANWGIFGSDNNENERLRAKLMVTYTDL